MGIEAYKGQFRRPNRTYNHAQCPKAWGPTSLRPCTRGVIVADFMDNGPLKGWGVNPCTTPLLGLFQDCLCGLYGLAWCNILSLLQLRKGLTLFHLWKGFKYTYPIPAPTAKGISITLPPLPHTTIGSNTTCWGDKYIGKFHWVINITYRDTL